MDQLYFVVHTHWDREWYQPFQQMRARLAAMADRMIARVESGEIESFHFDGQTIVLDDYLEVRPAMAARIRKLVRAGKIQIGPWYVLADSFLVSGESLIRNLERGLSTARRFGRALQVGYLPDQFGHVAQLPQILAGFGFRAAVLWRGVGEDVSRNRFIWEALDGSRILTVYLPFGYGNGANLPLESVQSFIDRAEKIAARERSYADGNPILVMTGTDHTEPDPRLGARIREAREVSEMSFEIGPLEPIVNRLADLPRDGLAVHRGELRSPLRAHLLPGVTSARAWIKQRDFQNCYLLERLADPLAAFAHACGRGRGLDDFLDLAWRIEMQNHPHDSICGCSVDQVHTDMRYRFDQAAMIAEDVIRRAVAELLGDGEAKPAAIAIFNPTFARQAIVSAESDLDGDLAGYAVKDAAGREIPVAFDLEREARTVETRVPASQFKPMVAALSTPAVMGRTITSYELRCGTDGAVELDLRLSRSTMSDVDLEAFREAVRSKIPDDSTITIRATSAPRYRVSFVASDLTQAGFTFFHLVPASSQRGEDASAAQAADSIENEFVSVSAASDGVAIRDLRSGAEFNLSFEDDGDRGDEYNFDPVPGASAVKTPAGIETRVLEHGPVRSRLAISLKYLVPAELAPDRNFRHQRMEALQVELTATLYQGMNRVDFDAAVANRSRDHRLRVALRTPIAAAEAVSDTSFGIIGRLLDRQEPPGTETIYPTAPHRTFMALESDTQSVALLSRGLYEVEARRQADGATTILLTLLRCVGWLSRSDLATRRGGAGLELTTPDAQELGEHRFEFAVMTGHGRYIDFVQGGAAYAYPPRSFNMHDTGAGALIGCDNPRVLFSTARIAPRDRAYRVRVYSASAVEESARFSFPQGSRVRMVDLAGRLIKGSVSRHKGSLEVELRPFQLATFEVTGAKST